MKLLDDALSKFSEEYKTNGLDKPFDNGSENVGVKFRVDSELAESTVAELNLEEDDGPVLDLLIDFARHDLEDLLVNGDTDNGDALLKGLDGEVKLGKTVSYVEIPKGEIHVRKVDAKESYELQLFMSVYAEFE